MSSMVWNIGLNSSIKAVKSSMVFIFSRYFRNGFKYLTVSLASRHAVLMSFNSLKKSSVTDVILWIGQDMEQTMVLAERKASLHRARSTANSKIV